YPSRSCASRDAWILIRILRRLGTSCRGRRISGQPALTGPSIWIKMGWTTTASTSWRTSSAPLMSFAVGDDVSREARWAVEWFDGDNATKTVRIVYMPGD